MTVPNAKSKLYSLLADFREGQLATVDFCDQFEKTYNFDLDKKILTPAEAEFFSALFEKVIWYAPYPEERAEIPNYIGEDEIRRAVDRLPDKLTRS